MNTLKLLALIALAFTFSRCKSPTQAMQSSPPSLFEVHTILDSAQSRFLRYADQTNGDPRKAIELTTDWLLQQPNVRFAVSLDSTNISIELNSGLRTTFSFDEVDDSGNSLFRGGGSGDVLKEFGGSNNQILSNNKVNNKKVLLFATDTKSLPGVSEQLQKTLTLLTNSGLGLNVTVAKDEQCSYGLVETFKDYGLVIIDGHGLINGFYVGSVLNLAAVKNDDELKNAIDAKAGSGTSDKLHIGQLALAKSIKVNPKKIKWQKSIIPTEDRSLLFTSDYVKLLPLMPNTILFGNMCNSGFMSTSVTVPARTITRDDDGTTYTQAAFIRVYNPLGKAFVDRKPISYYGYARDNPEGTSRSVPDNFAATMEDTLVTRLVVKVDSTRIVNLKPDNTTEYFDPPHLDYGLPENLYFRHFGADDYSYNDCLDNFTDARDGHVYKAVCIGTQTWMAENLDYDAAQSVCYNNQADYCKTYGKLYDYDIVMQGASATDADPSGVQGVCPKGWHVPSKAEWDRLITTLGGPDVAGTALTATSWGGTNTSGFNALPAGWYISAPSNFGQLGHMSLFAMTSKYPVDNFYAVELNGSPNVLFPLAQGTSCRCVKDP